MFMFISHSSVLLVLKMLLILINILNAGIGGVPLMIMVVMCL